MNAPPLPGPIPTDIDAGFWEACARRELHMRHCPPCGGWHHPPLPLCPHCQSSNLEWGRVEAPATLYSWTRVHVAMHQSMADSLPYHIGVIAFPKCGGARLIALLDHRTSASPLIGAECEIGWIVADTGQAVPVFCT